MDAKDQLTLLTELKNLLLKQCVTDCGLIHETTQRNKKTNKPVVYLVGEEKRYERLGLCSSPKNQHLGCAHTDYRLLLNRKLLLFKKNLPELSEKLSQFQSRLKELEMEVVTIDVKKSQAEKDLAQAREKQINTAVFKQSSHSFSVEHCATNEKIRAALKAFIDEIDSRIKLVKSTSG